MNYDDIKKIFEEDINELKHNTAIFEVNNYVLNLGDGKKYKYKVLYLMDADLGDFTDENNGRNIKYSMVVCGKDCITKDFNEVYIVVGQNPSYSTSKNIDKTNQSVYKALINNKIDSYLLLNTFPIINADGANAPDSLKVLENIDIAKNIIKKLKERGLKVSIVYACGASLPVYAKFIDEITALVNKFGISTYAFENGKELVSHMSMQYINSKSLDYKNFKLVPYKVQTELQKDFKKAIFKKGL